jgi:hypothetical protein
VSDLLNEYMRKNGIPLTTENYVALSGGTIDDLEGENLVEVIELVEAGILKNATPGSEEIQ